MDRDLNNLLGAVFAISGAVTAGTAFLNTAQSAEKKGLTLAGGLMLVGLGLVFLTKLDDAAIRTRHLLG